MGRGRQRGQTKIMSKIKDPVLGFYELWLEEDQIVLVDTSRDKTLSVGNFKELSKSYTEVAFCKDLIFPFKIILIFLVFFIMYNL